MIQMIITGIWTKLLDYDVDVYHQSGYNVMVEVVDGKIMATSDVQIELRPTRGTYRPPWRAPIAGWYRLDCNDGQERVLAAVALTPDMIVTQPARKLVTEQGDVVYRAPEIMTEGGGRVLTETEFGPVTQVFWS